MAASGERNVTFSTRSSTCLHLQPHLVVHVGARARDEVGIDDDLVGGRPRPAGDDVQLVVLVA